MVNILIIVTEGILEAIFVKAEILGAPEFCLMKEFHECNFDFSLPLLLLISYTLGLLYIFILRHLFALLFLDADTYTAFNTDKNIVNNENSYFALTTG